MNAVCSEGVTNKVRCNDNERTALWPLQLTRWLSCKREPTHPECCAGRQGLYRGVTKPRDLESKMSTE